MSHLTIGLISFAGIFGGALLGLFASRFLPRPHLSSETQTAVTVSVAVIGTLAALVLGLMITAANGSFTKRSEEVRELSLQLIRMDRNLRRYGPEAEDVRAKLRTWATAKIEQLFPEKGKVAPTSDQTIDMLEAVQDGLMALKPIDERQEHLRTLCMTLSSTMIQARWGLETHAGHSIPIPFLVLLIFWLAIVFASFGLFAPPNPTTMVALFLCAMAVAGGVFLIEDLDNPGDGFVRLPADAMNRAFTEITR
jgi:ABC-type amino acid transport system permease subunit